MFQGILASLTVLLFGWAGREENEEIYFRHLAVWYSKWFKVRIDK